MYWRPSTASASSFDAGQTFFADQSGLPYILPFHRKPQFSAV
jgi:hypothetical protein